MSGPFAEDPTVGGVPCLVHLLRRYLPKNKEKRLLIFRIQTCILTYVTYSFFNMARRPIAVVKSKIAEECNYTEPDVYTMDLEIENTENITRQWCKDMYFGNSTKEFLGFLQATYVATYGVVLYVSGIIADCYNPRYYLTCGCLMSGLFCALLGLSHSWGIRNFKYFNTILILFGASQAIGWPVVLSSVTHWYSGKRRGMFFGFWNTHNYTGSILGIFLAGMFVDKQWGRSFFLPGIILALMACIVFFTMVVDPTDLQLLDSDSQIRKALSRKDELQVPPWLKSNKSIMMYDALMLPGVLEYSICMFFSRMVGYIFLFWLPVFVRIATRMTATEATYYSLAYVIGGSLGGIIAGVLVDISRKSALVCGCFLLTSIPVLLLGLIREVGVRLEVDIPIFLVMGIFVEAPYVVISTSVSADLGTHRMIKRNHRAISTIGGIVEGTGAIGAAIGTYVSGIAIFREKWTNTLYLTIVLQFVAFLCISRQLYKDFVHKQKHSRIKIDEYWTV